MVNDRDLVGDLAAAHDENQRTVGIGDGLAHHIQLLLHQKAGVSRQEGGHTHGGGVCAVAGAEGIVDKNFSQSGILFSQLHVVLGFAGNETDVFQQQHLTGLQLCGLFLCLGTYHIGSQLHIHFQQLRQPGLHHLQGVLFLIAVLGTALVGAEDHRRALFQQITDGGQRLDDAAVIGDDALIVGGYVEITAAKDLFALQLCVHNGFLLVVHMKPPFNMVLSTFVFSSFHAPANWGNPSAAGLHKP